MNWIDAFINKFNESNDYKITDIRDREKLLDELRPHGEWIKTPELFRDRICSNCKRQISYEQIGDFCIKCGAKMKGGRE